MSVQKDGLEQFVAEVRRRGGSATRLTGAEALVEVQAGAGRPVRVKLKTKRRGDWQAQKSDANPRPENPIDAWVFVDVNYPIGSAPIVAAGWVRDDIQSQVQEWLAADPLRDSTKLRHHKIPEARVAEWRGRWDIIGFPTPATSSGDVTEDNLGAWVFKCNPKVWDLRQYMKDGNDSIDDWSVVDNYRSEMIRNGQRAILWASGPEVGQTPRGIWGIGWTTGQRYPSVDETQGYWTDEDKRHSVQWFAPTDITLMKEPLTAAEIRDYSGLEDLEVFRSPQGANPSWISKDQLARLHDLLEGWPEHEAGSGEPITVGAGGAGFGDPQTNKMIEDAAVDTATDHYTNLGYEVEDVGARSLGWDLTCIHASGDIRRVEVKGVSGPTPSILLTSNEIRSAREDENWELAVVTRALTKPTLAAYTASEVLEHAEGFVYRVDL
ncbi:protein NO VEIN domain-containing protein [Rhodococcus sp. WY5]|uniref:protein NO VEIN domain-containing protein n=1 Tax=Rhodococcus sp. WY5 TaxID=2708349 RepID=UPI001BDE77F9|nr:DUF3883 domain-containing protein [Rhodococcus sp. WY5]